MWWFVGCSAPEAEIVEQAPVEVRTWVEESAQGVGTFVVQVERRADLAVEVGVPGSSSLEIRPIGDVETEKLGDVVMDTQRWTFRGDPGHHEIPAISAQWEGGTSASLPLYVDIDAEPPIDEELADIAEPDPVMVIPWGWIGGGAACGLGAFAASGWLVRSALRKSAVKPVVRPDPPDVVAIRAWEAVRANASLNDHAKAVELSRIFREYAEIVLRFPATKWTTGETMSHLEGMKHLPEGNIPRAKRLLRATDRVKYADVAAGDIFDDLDADLRAFVLTTAPAHYSGMP